MPLKPDDTLLNGQYLIVRQLGRGGYGFVYQAQDTLLHKDVAIKELIPALLPSSVGDDEQALRRFLTEARATMDLTHEHIVRTHTVFPERENYYIVMAYLPGGSLEEHLDQHGRMPVEDAIRLGSEVASALAYAHARGVVHCDLKPANILRTAGGTYQVADFGIAHVSDQMMSRTWQTSAGLVVGTLPYMSPEQTTGQRDDPRLDVYALGAVLYHLLTGSTYVDFGEEDTPITLADNIYRIHNEKPLPPSEREPEIPEWLDEVILQALSKKPEERMTMAQLQAALDGGKVLAAHAPDLQPRALSAPTPELEQASAPSAPGLPHERAQLSKKESDQLRKLEQRHRRSVERERQRLRELEQFHAARSAEPGQEAGEPLSAAEPYTSEWADRLRRQIDEAVARSLETAGIWPDDILTELRDGEQPEELSTERDLRAKLEAARQRLEERAKRHASQRIVGPALDQLGTLLDRAVSQLDADVSALPLVEEQTITEPREPEPCPDETLSGLPPGEAAPATPPLPPGESPKASATSIEVPHQPTE